MIHGSIVAFGAVAPETAIVQQYIHTGSKNSMTMAIWVAAGATLVGSVLGAAVSDRKAVGAGVGALTGVLGGYALGRGMQAGIAALNAYDQSRGS